MMENHQYKLELIEYWNTYRVIRILLLLTVIIFTLLVIPVQADISSPVILGHDNQLIEQGAIGNIIWTINDTNPNKYWIKRNDTMVVSPTDYQNSISINIMIDTSTLGIWYYTIFANDTWGNTACDHKIITIKEKGNWIYEWMDEDSDEGTTITITELQSAIHHWLNDIPVRGHILSTADLQEVISIWLLDDTPPVILGPDNQSIDRYNIGTIGNITWKINEINPGNYWVFKDGIQIVPPTTYQNNTEINIPIDTSAIGLWCYTLFADDRSGNIASSQVNIIVQETSPLTILFPPNNYETTSTSICINGTVEGIGQEPSVIIINDKGYMEMADLNITNGFTGTYSGSIPLDYGTNKITVTAIYSQNNSESIEIMVIRTNNTKPLCGGGGGGGNENTQLNNYVFSKHYIVIAH